MAKMIINGEVYSGSTNYASAITYIKEDGTKSTVQKELDSRPVNNNLLINSNFANPVNQRGFTTATLNGIGKQYLIDRWCIINDEDNDISSVSLGNGFLQLNSASNENAGIYQLIDNLPAGVYSLSTKINDKVYKATLNFNNEYVDHYFSDGVWLGITLVDSYPTFFIAISPSVFTSVNIEWAKLELGEVATPYVPRLYQEEWLLCQRYYQIIHNNLFPWSATTSDMVFHQHFKPMRITPTISIIEAAVYLENQKQSGFKFRTDYKTNRRFNLYATKSSHGLKGKAYVGLFLNVALDAEL